MSLLEKSSNSEELFLESDLHLSSSDMRILKQRARDRSPDLGPYFEFLEDTGAFESRKIKAKLFGEEFFL